MNKPPKFGTKNCPKCNATNPAAIGKCKQCGAAFEKRKPGPRKPKADPKADLPEFCVGFTNDGRLWLQWPRDEEYIILTVEQGKVLELLIAARAKAPE